METQNTNPRLANLTDEQRDLLHKWRANALEGTGKVGLWVFGDRGMGSTYITWLAMNAIWRKKHEEWRYCEYKAREVISGKRELWTLERNPNRHDSEELTQDYYQLDNVFLDLWKRADCIWIDDLHDTADMDFWMRHVHPDIEARVKNRKAVVIATNMAPDHRIFLPIKRVIESLFIIIRAEYDGE